MATIQFTDTYQSIISVENLLDAWKEFLRGKSGREDVLGFERNLMANVLALHRDLAQKTYRHSRYYAFHISDPKPRIIHKASVRDRLLHHALYRRLYPFFDRTFIADSYSCRLNRGTHKAINQFRAYAYKVSQNHTCTAWVLQCDIKKFFASIDQTALMRIIGKYIPDTDILWLLSRIVSSFFSTKRGKGLPLGNVTSQLLVNIYMNEFDQFAKHKLKATYYIRYADDFVVLSDGRIWLEGILPAIKEFLSERLLLRLHPQKVTIGTVASGVDYLGWVHFSDHRVLRTSARRRMFGNIAEKKCSNETIQSYLGLLRHGNTNKLMHQVHAWTRRKSEGGEDWRRFADFSIAFCSTVSEIMVG